MAVRQNFARAVRNEIGERAKNAIGEPCCEWCFATKVERQLHHLNQDAMQSAEKKRKPLTAKDGVLICIQCHQPESAQQAVVFNKSERVREKHNGVEIPTRSPIPGRALPGPKAKDRSPSDKVMARRNMFQDA